MIGAVGYIVYTKIILMYYKYFYYKSQGVPTVAFPLPLIGNILLLKREIDRQESLKWSCFEEYWSKPFKGGKLPPVIASFHNTKGVLLINDPHIVEEIYITKNKFIDKDPRPQRIFSQFFKNSILFGRTDELWSLKRKHLSAAFYKEKLQGMLAQIIKVVYETIEELKKTHVKDGT